MSSSRPLDQLRPSVRPFATEIDKKFGDGNKIITTEEIAKYESAMGQSSTGPATADLRKELSNPAPSKQKLDFLNLVDGFYDSAVEPARTAVEDFIRSITGTK